MLSQLPSAAYLRAVAGTRSTVSALRVPPLALAVRLTPTADPSDPDTLLGRCVSMVLVPHPTLDALLRRAGGVRAGDGYLLDAPQQPTDELVVALAAVHPGSWRPGGRATVPASLGAGLLAALTAAGAAPVTNKPKRLAGMSLRVARTGRRLRVTPAADGVRVAGRDVTRRLLVDPFDAVDLAVAARAGGLVVVDADRPGRLAALEDLVGRGCVVEAVPGAPAWARLRTGPGLSLPARGPLPAVDAVAQARRAPTPAAVAVNPVVAQVAAATAAGVGKAPVRSVPGLHRWQEAFVAAYLACGPGMVNALPPGEGKSVCAAAAMVQRAADETGGRYRGVVLAPASLRGQWSVELGRFFPAARVRVAETAADLVAGLEEWREAVEPVVWVLTPQLLARSEPAQQLTVTDLVVDEATFLANPGSVQARACWRLRARSAHAMVLSGTPAARGVDGLGALVAFARGHADLFAELPLSQPHPDVTGDRLGALVFTGTTAARARLPEAAARPVVHSPGEAERLIEQTARDRVAELLARGRRAVPQLRTELEAWRLGLACPAALLASRYGLAEAVRAAGLPATVGVKSRWVVDRVSEQAASGEQTLVFGDFPAALETVRDELAAAGVEAGLLSSAVPARRRAVLVGEFAAGRLPVLLISATGQLGLNLQTAASVLHLDVPTNRTQLVQRTARAARLGSTHARVSVEVPVLDGCADQALLLTMQRAAAGLDPRALAELLCRTTKKPAAA